MSMLATILPTGDERRQHRRYRVHLAIAVDTDTRHGDTARVGVSQDASVDGLLFNTRSRVSPGESVTLTLHVSTDATHETRVAGKIVRVQSVEAHSPLPWRYLAAVRFEHPVVELESSLVARAAERHNDIG
jgi:hypothetical protein